MIKQIDNIYLYIDKIYKLNIQHLKYVLEVNTHRHCAKSAEKCFVTQPTQKN